MPVKLNKKEILTIPNLLSFFRLILIPVIIWLYISKASYYGAFAVVVLSGLTDILDGKIARKYNMITEFGKILDPIADKLTQAALIICLISRYKLMWALIALFTVKELVSAALGYLSLQASGEVGGAQWYGKVNTVLLYAVMILLIVFPGLPLTAANALIILCAVSLIVAFICYIHFFWDLIRQQMELLKKAMTWQTVIKIAALCLWMVLALFCLVYKDTITTEFIVSLVPKDSLLAAAAMLILFGFKSIAVFIYAGLLYAANGILFTRPLAIVMSVFGSIVMFTVPYLIGRFGASGDMKKLSEKYPNVKLLQGFPSESKFMLCFVARIIGILPLDMVSLYMGTVRANYAAYLLGSLCGMAVSITTFTVMGMTVNTPSAPGFYIALIVEVAVNCLSLIAFLLYKRKFRKAQ